MEYQTNTSICKITKDVVIKEYITTDTKKIQKEIEILKEFKNEKGFPKIKKIKEENGRTIIEMDYLGEEIKCPNDDEEVRRMIKEILNLICKLHSHGIIHNDIKLNNILMNDIGEISIIDFSHSIKISEDNIDTTLCYTAPEKIKSIKSDIWSIGCIYYELLTDKILFDVETKKEFEKMIQKKEHIKLIKNRRFNKIDESLMLKMLEIDPRNRMIE